MLNKLIIFFKRPGFLGRIFLISSMSMAMYLVFIPDIKHLIKFKNEPTISFSELIKMNKEDIPKYLKISEALVPANSYVEYRKNKSNELKEIYYPVFSENSKLNGKIHIIINDYKVTDEELKSGNYFKSGKFIIRGRYQGSFLNSKLEKLITLLEKPISENPIILTKDAKRGSLSTNIIFVIVLSILILLFILSFIPAKFLVKQQKIRKTEPHRNTPPEQTNKKNENKAEDKENPSRFMPK